MPAESRPADWRAELDALGLAPGRPAHPEGPPHGPGEASGRDLGRGIRSLALQFELRHRRERRSGEWQGPRDEPAKRAETVDRLAVRPVAQGARGAWVKAGLTWQNIAFQGSSQGFDPEQARWFAQFALLKGRSPSVFTTYGSEWITLDEYESPLLWALLADAERRGIALVGGAATPSVALAASVEIGYDARVTDASSRGRPASAGAARGASGAGHAAGDLVLEPVVVLDGEPHPVGDARPVGDHGVYRFAFARGDSRGEIRLGPVAGGLGAVDGAARPRLALLDRPRGIRVPAGETVEFLRTAYPRLVRSVAIVSSDGSFEPPPPVPATLVLDARFEPGDVLRLAWRWEHADGRISAVDAEPPGAGATGGAATGAAATGGAATGAADPDLDPDVVELARDELGGMPMTPITLRGGDVAWFADRVIRRLERLDRVRVDVSGDPPDYREAGTPALAVTAVESPKTDWFDLGVIVTVDGRKVPFMPLFRALAKGQRRLLLVDKTYLDLKQPLFEPLRDLIEEAGTLREWETGVRIHRSQVGLWADFEDLADESAPAVEWRDTVAALAGGAESGVAELEPPVGLAVALRPYQLAGFRWLALLHRSRLGGILADDMGLGKTVQALALMAWVREQGAGAPFLVVAPSSVASNWVAEASRFTPGLRVASVTATDAAKPGALAAAVADADVVVTTYAVLRLDADRFAALEWAGLVLDEAQFVKNASTNVHEAARAIRAAFRLALTGTPIENHTGELWAILRIVAPGLLPSRRAFDERYRRPIEAGSRERIERLRRRVRPLLLRRTKEEVAPELPPRQEQVLTVALAPRHRRLYDATLQRERTKLLGLVDDLDRQRHIVYRSLTLLRMLALDASLVDPAHEGMASAKLDALFEQLEDVLAEGHRALVFSQFTSFLGRVRDRLDADGVSYAWLDGSTPLKRRDAEIERFRSGEASVFCISLKAGGFGLNLTEADYVFLLDPWWNPASEQQAIDRAHRIGQRKRVMVYRLVAADTIEEKVMALKRRKGELVASVLDAGAEGGEGGAGVPALTADDLRGLLGAPAAEGPAAEVPAAEGSAVE
ncbi:DNA/RNA helicase [Agromyces sp. CFH 90414]|uniref:DNA/RNA helicase n=1 Tax=Agromyces agglutinans TaxID=2662258 RepID=A0A6I2F6R2_9MICO|nr:DEAD/DEAH box helicase [Agromyces agglutinans]MRG60011.1 DNA/RNA helicase [Agromyces agglutinans]